MAMRSSSSMWRSRPTARRSTVSFGPGGQHGRAGGCLEVGPALAAVVDVVEVEAGLVEEPGEVEVGALPAQGAQLVDLGRPARRDGLSQAAQDDLGGLLVELHVAAGGQERELQLHGSFDVAAGAAEQGPVAAVEAELACGGCRRSRGPCRTPCPVALRRPRPSCWRNSVGLSVGRSMSTVSTAGTSTPSLNRSTENTARTSSGGQVPQGGLALGSRAVAPHGDRRRCRGAVKWRAMKRACSTLTQNPRQRIVAGVGVLGDLLDDEAGPGVGAGVGVAEGLDVVAAASAPRDVAQVEAVVDAEVEERREVLLVDGVPEAQLGGDAIVEPVQDRAGRRCARGWR